MGRELFRLAWPGALTLLLNNFYRVNDLYFVGKLAAADALAGQAAVAVANMVTILTFAFYEGLATGVLAMSARAHGGREPYRARIVLRVALVLAVSISAVVAVGGLWSLDRLVAWLVDTTTGQGAPGVATERAALAGYLRPIFGCGFFLCLAPVVSHAFLAAKDTITPLVLELVAVLLNVALNAVLVLGIGEFEGLGVAGAGWATVGSRAATSLIGLALLLRRLPRRGMPDPRSPMRIGWTMARIGAPVTAAIAMFAIAYQIVLNTTFPAFGAVGRAAFGCGFTLEGLAFCLIWGLSMATGSLVGNALGARRPDLADAVIRQSVRTTLVLIVPLTAMFLLLPGPLADILTDNAEIRAAVIVYLQVLAWSQFAVGLQGVWENSLSSSGHSLPVFYSTTIWNLSRIPLCYLLAIPFEGGLAGVWWAINLSSYGKALTAGLVVRRGTWKRIEV